MEKTIYDYLSCYPKEEVDNALSSLSLSDREIIDWRLKGLKSSDLSYKRFYDTVIPKLRRQIEKSIESKKFKFDCNIELLELLKKNLTCREICRTLDISSQDLHRELLKLKGLGVDTLKEYGFDGSIKYHEVRYTKEVRSLEDVGSKAINVPEKINKVKLLLVSDLHFGNSLQRLDLVNKAFDYCVANGINLILCGGDFVDGSFTCGKQCVSDPYKQVEFFLNNYPRDDSILTFGVGGDHDLSLLHRYGLNLIKLCDDYRHDIVIGDFGNTLVGLKKSFIQLYHSSAGNRLSKPLGEIILHGHHHKFKIETNCNEDKIDILLPALCDIISIEPSALELTINFKGNSMENIGLKQIGLKEKPCVLSEFDYTYSNPNGKVKKLVR